MAEKVAGNEVASPAGNGVRAVSSASGGVITNGQSADGDGREGEAAVGENEGNREAAEAGEPKRKASERNNSEAESAEREDSQRQAAEGEHAFGDVPNGNDTFGDALLSGAQIHANGDVEKWQTEDFSLGAILITEGVLNVRREFLKYAGNVLELRLEFAGALIAEVGLVLERAQYNFIQADVQLHFFGRRIETAERQVAGQHFVQDDAQRVNVGAMIDLE